jgi:6-pyruvoyltetrahydropterin/6-carboxytetrahydropterin synthase
MEHRTPYRYTLRKVLVPFASGMSIAIRNHRADSHCKMLHGYALQVEVLLGANDLDERGWVFDFGKFGALRQRVVHEFDHRAVIGYDDPEKANIANAADVKVLRHPSCEGIAAYILELAQSFLGTRVLAVTVREHEANEVTVWANDA